MYLEKSYLKKNPETCHGKKMLFFHANLHKIIYNITIVPSPPLLHAPSITPPHKGHCYITPYYKSFCCPHFLEINDQAAQISFCPLHERQHSQNVKWQSTKAFKAFNFRTTQGTPGTGDASIYLKRHKTELQKSRADFFFLFHPS